MIILWNKNFSGKDVLESVLAEYKEQQHHYTSKRLTLEYYFSNCIIPRAQLSIKNMDSELD